jgi:2'-hydroxyisoflavone reductase
MGAEDTVEAVKLLVLGGTKFVGRAAVEAALARGHEVTLFNRGLTNPDLFPEAEKLRGDKEGDLSVLGGRSWDAVLDPSAYTPGPVREATALLADAVEHYVFVSSLSVYADVSRPYGEDADLQRLEEGQPNDRLLEDFSNYGPLKVLSEQAVAAGMPGRHSIVRPGLIVGPYDPTGRFTYWPNRVARGGEVLAPAPAEDPFQVIDVRDFGEWLITVAEQRVQGAFNAVHPGIAWRHLIETCLAVTGSDATIAWVDGDFLLEQGVEPWSELPVWIRGPEYTGFHRADVSRAMDAGLAFRPLAETIAGTLEQAAASNGRLTPEREAELIRAWRAR